MSTDTEKRYISKPGGVILRMADGTSQSFRYGAPVPLDQLADHQKATAGRWSDTTFRGQSGDERIEAAAHARAAQSQHSPNSSTSPVPSNYADLSEDEAVAVMSRYADNPDAQAAMVVHETLYGGNRQRVIDASSDYAKGAASVQIDTLVRHKSALDLQRERAGISEGDSYFGPPQTSKPDSQIAGNIVAHQMARDAEAGSLTPPPSGGDSEPSGGSTASLAEPTPVPPGQPEEVQQQVAERHGDGGAGTEGGTDFSDEQAWTKANLHAYAEQHSIETNQSDKRDVLVQKIQAAGHDKPQTPPPSS